MAKTNPIGVRFDTELWDTFDKMGIRSAQKILNFLETWYLDNLEKVIAYNNLPEKKAEIESKRDNVTEKKIKQPLTMQEVMEDNPMPIRMKGEDAFDFAARKNEWKKSLK